VLTFKTTDLLINIEQFLGRIKRPLVKLENALLL